MSYSLRGEITVPGDKSISHRGIMLGSLAEGTTELEGFLDGADCRSTIACFRSMGIDITQNDDHVIIHGKGLHGLSEPSGLLDVGNSGTTTRLMSGILAGQKFTSHLNGDESIQTRPMGRIITPLTQMGAVIASDRENGCAPLTVSPAGLTGITYRSPVASAQVKSCVLFAGMYAQGETTVIEPALSRNHTELMVNGFGGKVISKGNAATITPEPKLIGQHIQIPGDISSAAYFIAAALITPGSSLLIKNVNTNPTRDGILRVAEAMGGKITRENKRIVSGEEVCDLLVEYSSLHGITFGADWIPTLIDEIPVIAVMAAAADGQTVIKDAQELKVKESNRIDTVVNGLKAMGVDAVGTEDGMIINGGKPLHSADIATKHDHRIAMAFTVAGLLCDGVNLDDPDCVVISYPTFYKTLESVTEK